MRKTILFLIPFLLVAGASHRAFGREMDSSGPKEGLEDIEKDFSPQDEPETKFHFMPAVFGGYNQLLKGYPGYQNLGNVGAEVWARPITTSIEEPSWYTDNFLVRLSAEWMPLQVPKGNYGLVEDMYALTGQIVFKFDSVRDAEWMPFLGVGAGGYWDHLSLDTPASGKITGTHYYFGMNATAGIFFPPMGPFRLETEARYHRLQGPNAFWPQNITYQVGLIYGFGYLAR